MVRFGGQRGEKYVRRSPGVQHRVERLGLAPSPTNLILGGGGARSPFTRGYRKFYEVWVSKGTKRTPTLFEVP